MTKVVIAPRAQQDLQNITDHYLVEAGVEVASSFLQAWDRTVGHIERHPESGSPRLSEMTKVRGLRVWPVMGFPHIAVYVGGKSGVVVTRVLHTSRDIPVTLRD
jgi:toxin ParE1/3/4